MKKQILVYAIIISMITSCSKPFDKNDYKTYPSYGIFNKDVKKSKNVCYEISTLNVATSIITLTTVFIPLYLIGYSLYKPVGFKDADGKCGIDANL